jgi:hypothetical protein
MCLESQDYHEGALDALEELRDAIKEGIKTLYCASCKHSTWFDKHAMFVCEKHDKACTDKACDDYEDFLR